MGFCLRWGEYGRMGGGRELAPRSNGSRTMLFMNVTFRGPVVTAKEGAPETPLSRQSRSARRHRRR